MINKIKSVVDLDQLQKWYKKVIETPLDGVDMDLKEIKKKKIFNKIPVYILPNPDLSAIARIEVYNQQYWFRLLGIMQEEFPMVCEIMGIHIFNFMATEYLVENQSKHYSLNLLGRSFPEFLAKHYTLKNHKKILTIAEYELKNSLFFDAKMDEVLTLNDIKLYSDTELLSKKLQCHKCVAVFAFNYDFLSYSKQLKEKNLKNFDSKIKLKTKKNYVLLYRIGNNLREEHIDKNEYALLTEFIKGAFLTDTLENTLAILKNTAQEKIQSYFLNFMQRELFRK
jgi:hypothetical protein